MAVTNSESAFVQTNDELMNAVAAAHARADSIYFSASKTLIDQMSIQEFADLDDSAEMTLVSDPCGLEDDYDLFDEDDLVDGVAA